MDKIIEAIKENMPHDPFCHLGLETKDGIISCDCKRDHRISNLTTSMVNQIKDKSFELMETCEPDCDEVRHALHEGSWQHMNRINEWADSLIDKNAE